FGPHNLHENRAGSFRSERFVFVTYFSAGVVVYDLADPAAPQIAAHWQPETPPGQAAPQTNDLFVDTEGLIWLSDRVGGGLCDLELMHEATDEMEAAIDSADAYVAADIRYHLVIAEATGNRLLLHLMQAIRERLTEMFGTVFKFPGGPERSIAQHRLITQAIA